MNRVKPILSLVVLGLIGACAESEDPSNATPPPPADTDKTTAATESGPPIRFEDALAASGITWRHVFIDDETGSTYKLNPYDHGSGVLVADVNNDGYDDLYFMNFLGDNALYLGRGDGSFADHTDAAGVAMARVISVGGCFGDYDNDGDADLYVTTYRNGNKLFRNEGDGTFEDVTDTAGVGYVGHSNSATFFDYDLDGDLDLYLTNIGPFTTETINEQAGFSFYEGEPLDILLAYLFNEDNDTSRQTPGEDNVLWRNGGDGTFEDVTDVAGVGSPSWNGDCAVSDYDGDGDLDLYVANMFGPNHLYQNNGDGTFTDVAAKVLKKTTWGAIGSRFFDANNDAWPELLVVDMHSDMWIPAEDEETFQALEPTAKYPTPAGGAMKGRRGQPVTGKTDSMEGVVLFGNSFFENLGDGRFEERSDRSGLETYWPWGVTIADFDYDGLQDVFLPSGMSYPYPYWPNVLLRNAGDLKFERVTEQAGLEPRPGGNELDLVIRDTVFARSSRTAVVLDFDQDGDLDLVINNFNDVPHVYANVSPAKSWIAFDLVGGRGNTSRDAIGSTVSVTAEGITQTRMVENATGYLCQSTHTLYFGIPSGDEVDSVKVQWIGGEEEDVTAAVKVGMVNRVTQ